MFAGSEVYMASLEYYQLVKLGAKMNIGNAKLINVDLKRRFEGQGKTKPLIYVVNNYPGST